MSLQFATNRLIDSVWTLGFEFVDGKVKIHSYDRDTEIGYTHEKLLMQASIIEDDQRIVRKVKFRKYQPFGRDFDSAQEYEVVNPQHVFSYSK